MYGTAEVTVARVLLLVPARTYRATPIAAGYETDDRVADAAREVQVTSYGTRDEHFRPLG